MWHEALAGRNVNSIGLFRAFAEIPFSLCLVTERKDSKLLPLQTLLELQRGSNSPEIA